MEVSKVMAPQVVLVIIVTIVSKPTVTLGSPISRKPEKPHLTKNKSGSAWNCDPSDSPRAMPCAVKSEKSLGDKSAWCRTQTLTDPYMDTCRQVYPGVLQILPSGVLSVMHYRKQMAYIKLYNRGKQ